MSTLGLLAVVMSVGILAFGLAFVIAVVIAMMPPWPDCSKYDHREDDL